MAKNNLWSFLGRIPKWLGEQLGWIQTLAEQIGLKGTVTALVIPSVVAAWVWMRSHVPLWLAVALLFFLLACAASFFRNIVVARSLLRFDPGKTKDLGESLYELSKAILDFAHDNPPPRRVMRPATGEDVHAEWARGIEEQNRIYSRFLSQFGPRIQAKYILLQKLGVPVPFHARAGHFHGIATVGLFLGAVGDLLKAGYLEEARLVSDRDAFYMQ